MREAGVGGPWLGLLSPWSPQSPGAQRLLTVALQDCRCSVAGSPVFFSGR